MALTCGVALPLLSAPAVAQGFKPDDPVPPDAKAIISELRGEVLALRPVILDLKLVVLPLRGEVLPLKGVVTAMQARVNPLQAALKDLGATVREKEIKINLAADVLFDFDKADLRAEAAPALAKVADVLKAHPKAAVTIEGHTDGKGTDAYNQPLSQRRAESVRRWLAEHGIGSKMATRGLGKSKPIAPNAKPNGADDPEGRQKNRRVEITVRTP